MTVRWPTLTQLIPPTPTHIYHWNRGGRIASSSQLWSEFIQTMAHSLWPWYGGYIPWPFTNAIFMNSSGLTWAISNLHISIHGWHLEYTKDPSRDKDGWSKFFLHTHFRLNQTHVLLPTTWVAIQNDSVLCSELPPQSSYTFQTVKHSNIFVQCGFTGYVASTLATHHFI